ncbi:MAG TPA: hypothetical protein VFQ00_05180 [Terriglobales bacterium]|nr:hypothetical protein [Terriglobales bacterium]
MVKKFPIALVILSSLCAVCFAQTKPALPASLQVSGPVKVNSEVMGQAASTVFPGDRIETGEHAAARVALPGLTLLMDANSCVTYEESKIDVWRCSTLEITSARPIVVAFQSGGSKLNASALSVFRVDNRGRDLRVTTREGTVQIQHGTKALAAVSGPSTKSFAGLGCSAAAVRHTEEAGAAGGAGAAIAASVLSESSHRPTISAVKPE